MATSVFWLTGVDNLTIDNIKIDTDRDGIDIDCCQNVRVSNCTVNSPWDDGICPKSSYGLGYARAHTQRDDYELLGDGLLRTGFGAGSERSRSSRLRPAWPRTGRIKCGTESNGGFINIITISNRAFLKAARVGAIESVDGAIIEDLTITNTTMRDLVSPPFFLRRFRRAAARAEVREPKVGVMRRIATQQPGLLCRAAAAGIDRERHSGIRD